ncbi:MAG: SHOCT domain-containing protein [Betaproteobacteria bacterium]|nr:SHOCT domain-containing protein [Betaproteobacteria bacterium]
MGNFEPGMMGGYGIGWGFGGIFMMLWWALIIGGIVILVRWLSGASAPFRRHADKTALELLAERYARGEIPRDTYEQMRHDIRKSEAAE